MMRVARGTAVSAQGDGTSISQEPCVVRSHNGMQLKSQASQRNASHRRVAAVAARRFVSSRCKGYDGRSVDVAKSGKGSEKQSRTRCKYVRK
jgi:hypothetical protein